MNAVTELTTKFNVRKSVFFGSIKNKSTQVQQNSSLMKQSVLSHDTNTCVTYNKTIIKSSY